MEDGEDVVATSNSHLFLISSAHSWPCCIMFSLTKICSLMIKHSQRQALKAKAWQPRSVDGSWLHLKFSPLTPSKHLKIRLFWFFGLFFYTTGPFFVLFFYTMPLQSRLEHSSKKVWGLRSCTETDMSMQNLQINKIHM